MKTKKYNNRGEDVSVFIELLNKAAELKHRYNDESHNRYYNGMYNMLQIAMYQSVANAWKYAENIPSLI